MNLSRFYAIAQIEYCRNLSSNGTSRSTRSSSEAAEIGLWRLTANRISAIFGVRLHKTDAPDFGWQEVGGRRRPSGTDPAPSVIFLTRDKADIAVNGPFGTDCYFLVATATPIPDPTILQ